MTQCTLLRAALAVLTGAIMLVNGTAHALDKVSFATNWIAEAEHGGYYQAVADGTYRKYGLDVTIVPGGPQKNNRLLLQSGRIDFYMGANMLRPFAVVDQGIPTVVVAAIFQKDPQVLLAHPDAGVEKFSDLRNLTILASSEGVGGYYRWLKSEHGFRDEQVRPYTFNPQPFLVDKTVAMQGYVSSEPYMIEKQGGFKPKIFLLADHGFDTYSTTIETRIELVRKNPDLVQRFVDASIIGWYNYLYGDNRPGNALIKEQNPDMTDDLIAFAVEKLKEYGIVDSGDTLKLGIGAMTEARVKSFRDRMVQAGVVNESTDWRRSFTTRFVNRKVGLNLRPN